MIATVLWTAIAVLTLAAIREVWIVHRALLPRTDQEWIGMALIFTGIGGLLLLVILQ